MLELIIYAFHSGTNTSSMKFHNKIGLVSPQFIQGYWKYQISSWIVILKGNLYCCVYYLSKNGLIHGRDHMLFLPLPSQPPFSFLLLHLSLDCG